MNKNTTRNSQYFSAGTCSLDDFIALVSQILDPEDVPNAADVKHNIPIYDMELLRADLRISSRRRELMSEWGQVLKTGPGVLALKTAYSETGAIDEATEIYLQIIEDEKQASQGGGDHFAAAGANDRIWNALQKLCEASPETFLRYFGNAAIDAVCEAWLGPNYQMTAQVNLVHPGGEAQLAHRDYHLGFQTEDVSATYPSHVHDLSPVLTLQGGIIHGDTPIESGPTKLLPFSQLYRPGYLAWRRDDFRAYFERHYAQVALQKGDAVFFNPALFHAAGANSTSDNHRMVNLLQVSSAFGRAMESVDRAKICGLLYPSALAAKSNGDVNTDDLLSAVSAAAEGYSFPTNLDHDPPNDGLATETQKALFMRALDNQMEPGEFSRQLAELGARQQA